MSILNSVVFRVFSEKAVIFCGNLLFYFLGFFMMTAKPKSS
jgi:hypothetical protein